MLLVVWSRRGLVCDGARQCYVLRAALYEGQRQGEVLRATQVSVALREELVRTGAAWSRSWWGTGVVSGEALVLLEKYEALVLCEKLRVIGPFWKVRVNWSFLKSTGHWSFLKSTTTWFG